MVAELLLVPAAFYLLIINHLISFDSGPLPEHPLARFRQQQGEGMVLIVLWGFLPGVAALAGGALSVLWSGAALVWRWFKDRSKPVAPVA